MVNKTTILQDLLVQQFIEWALPKINQPGAFVHTYRLPARSADKVWACESIFDAYQKYNWRFKSIHPTNLTILRGASFEESAAYLDLCTATLHASLEERNLIDLRCSCHGILQWGGVARQNLDTIYMMENHFEYFENVQQRLNAPNVSLSDNFKGINMNSGFTKIYAMFLEDFMIYDSRVGAALGWLVRLFLEENQIQEVPASLRFAYGVARSKGLNRNPSSNTHKFPVLRNDPVFHLKNNLKANWVCGELVKVSRFNEEPQGLRALEAALFMIGYHIPASK
jgi:hypothetical protein